MACKYSMGVKTLSLFHSVNANEVKQHEDCISNLNKVELHFTLSTLDSLTLRPSYKEKARSLSSWLDNPTKRIECMMGKRVCFFTMR